MFYFNNAQEKLKHRVLSVRKVIPKMSGIPTRA